MAHEKRYRKPPPFRVFDKPENNHETYIVAKMLLDLHLDYGRCDDPCSACGTLDWKLERNRRDRNKPFTDYPTCCSKGSVKLETGDQGLIFIDGPPGTEMNEHTEIPVHLLLQPLLAPSQAHINHIPVPSPTETQLVTRMTPQSPIQTTSKAAITWFPILKRKVSLRATCRGLIQTLHDLVL
ncbi:hypothetical protein PCASD_25902 [Puccinia coronata f. sp. avenae]|uniref:Uncharacterized protein n=1 Tax=Puccinia coronata f. sp. avenae TaxID=200324 RepID=A0A2N5S166_9BASI|nr:hypothetical protein PCASD_25902 [Puccinia coronata f. sp. avenae]